MCDSSDFFQLYIKIINTISNHTDILIDQTIEYLNIMQLKQIIALFEHISI